MKDYTNLGLNSNLRANNSLSENKQEGQDAATFDAIVERAVITNAKIADASIDNAKLGTAVIGTANIGTLSFNEISGGTATLGGTNNGNGLLSLQAANGTEIVKLDNTGLTINQGSMTIKDTNGTTIMDSTGLVSTANFANGGTTDTNEFNTTSTSYVDVTNMSLTIPLTRTANVLVGGGATGRRNSTVDSATAFLVIDIGGTIQGGVMDVSGVLTSDGRHNTSVFNSSIVSLNAGTYTAKLRLKAGGTETGQARLVSGSDYAKNLFYVILGK